MMAVDVIDSPCDFIYFAMLLAEINLPVLSARKRTKFSKNGTFLIL